MKRTIISLLVGAALIGGAILFSGGSGLDTTPSVDNVSIIDNRQIVAINAKGGYSPRLTAAKADLPTVIRITTNGTFDCSSAFTIPSIGYRTNLPQSGVTDVDLPPQKSGTTLTGLCSMGMYSFAINFN